MFITLYVIYLTCLICLCSSVVKKIWYQQLGQVLHGAGHALASSGSSRGATAAENGGIAPCCSHFIRKNDDEPVDLEWFHGRVLKNQSSVVQDSHDSFRSWQLLACCSYWSWVSTVAGAGLIRDVFLWKMSDSRSANLRHSGAQGKRQQRSKAAVLKGAALFSLADPNTGLLDSAGSWFPFRWYSEDDIQTQVLKSMGDVDSAGRLRRRISFRVRLEDSRSGRDRLCKAGQIWWRSPDWSTIQ